MYDPEHPVPTWRPGTMRRLAEQPTLADAALSYANLGIPVFPSVPGGKQPLTPNGFHDATSSARMVSYWWRRNPDANIGLPTGARTGIVVVDVDVHNGSSGYAAFDRARGAGLAEDWTWLVRTPSGGLHAYFAATPGLEQRNWTCPAAHIDFRGDGGYVVAPPSRIRVDGTERSYEYLAGARRGLRPIDADGLRTFLDPPRPVQHSAQQLRRDATSTPERLAAYVARLPQGGRNDGLFWAACEMVRTGHGIGETRSALVPAGTYAGLDAREIETSIRSAYRIVARCEPTSASRPGPTRPSEGIGM